jgi:polysaccharide deacetylase 2 family uncharacterized protein YibQ
MTHPKKKTRAKKKVKKPVGFFTFKRVFVFFFLTMLVAVSVFAAGYVIFFRTVFAGEISTAVKSGIVFEEPDPPVHEEQVTDKPVKGTLLEKQLPKVAIVIDDLGYHEKIGNKFLNFPIELTYSFLPFAPHTGKQEKIAFNSEKTVILHLPLEPKDSHWEPGPGALLLTDSLEMQKNKLDQALTAVPHAVGVNSHMGSGYTENVEKMKSLLRHIGAKDLFFIDSFTTAKSVGLQMAQELGLKSSRRHVFLDNVLDEDEICNQLEKLVKMAERMSFAIGIGHPHIETYRALEKCIPLYVNSVKFVGSAQLLKSTVNVTSK